MWGFRACPLWEQQLPAKANSSLTLLATLSHHACAWGLHDTSSLPKDHSPFHPRSRASKVLVFHCEPMVLGQWSSVCLPLLTP